MIKTLTGVAGRRARDWRDRDRYAAARAGAAAAGVGAGLVGGFAVGAIVGSALARPMATLLRRPPMPTARLPITGRGVYWTRRHRVAHELRPLERAPVRVCR